MSKSSTDDDDDGLIRTIFSDDEDGGDTTNVGDDDEGEEVGNEITTSFTFRDMRDSDDEYGFADDETKQNSWDMNEAINRIKGEEERRRKERGQSFKTTSLEDKIRRHLEAKAKSSGSGASASTGGNENEGIDAEDSHRSLEKKEKKKKNVKASESKEKVSKVKDTDDDTGIVSFSQLNLTRPILRAVQALGFERPTPIQAKAIPFILEGRDVLGSAVTGSGKTAAYLLPTLERLLYRPKNVAVTRVLVVVPTRELAQQVVAMMEKLAQFTNIRATAIVGGLSISVQAATLRSRPDVVVATPGRLIDHVRNSHSVDLDDVEVLILDEADRLLELGFQDEVNEVVKFCPKGRQTMLFSATLSENVNKLADLSLNRPKRVCADPLMNMAQRLVQEFVRIRDNRQQDREAMLLSLCTKTFKTQTIVFFQRKHRAHKMSIVFGLLGMRSAELHGNLTQSQRLESLQKFRDGAVDFLLCTDLASRGLDIQGVRAVINFEMPKDIVTYVHRVGRTARAGKGGRALTLVLEKQRKAMKEVVKRSKQNVKSRQIATKTVDSWRERLGVLEEDVINILREEKMEKQVRVAEMEANKAGNMMLHHDEIMSRPKRTWFQTQQEKLAAASSAQQQQEEEKQEVETKKKNKKNKKEEPKKKKPHRLTRAKRRRMAIYEEEALDAKAEIAEDRAAAEERGEVFTEDDARRPNLQTLQKMSARSVKRKAQKEDNEFAKFVPGESMKKKRQSNNVNGDSVVRRVQLGGAFGGSSFDSELAMRAKKKRKHQGGGNVFKDRHQLNKGGLKKGGKASHHGFKSKSKFKRKRK